MASEKQPVLILPVTHDTLNNNHTTVFGGWIMSQMDIAASIPAVIRTKGAVVTKLVKEINFKSPGRANDLFYFYADISHVGTTSLTVDIEVIAHRDINNIQKVLIATGEMVFVAIDESGKPRKISSD